jgi:hypothetical protein
MSRTHSIAFFLIMVVCVIQRAHSCTPSQQPPGYVEPTLSERIDSSFEATDYVFSAQVVSLAIKPGDGKHFVATLKVGRIYKGNVGSVVRFEVDAQPSPCPSIAPYPKLGDTSLYFAKAGVAGQIDRAFEIVLDDISYPMSVDKERSALALESVQRKSRQNSPSKRRPPT